MLSNTSKASPPSFSVAVAMPTSAPSPRLSTVFAQNLLVARTARDWTQQALAVASNVSRATIAQLEAGTGDPKLSTVQQLAEALGVSAVILLLGKVELEALAGLTDRTLEGALVQNPAVSTMRHLVGSGIIRSRMEAAQIGIGIARQARLTEGGDSVAVGAAIGSYHAPGRGTLAAAHLADLLGRGRGSV